MRRSIAVLCLLCVSGVIGAGCHSPVMGAMVLLAPGAGTNNLAHCEKTVDDASTLSRTLYWATFPGAVIGEVDLYLTSKDKTDTYTVRLDVIVNGATAASVTGTAALTQDVNSFFAFPLSTALTVAAGANVRFAVTKVGGGGDLSYGGQTSASCELVTTADSSSTTQIVGPKIPIRVLSK